VGYPQVRELLETILPQKSNFLITMRVEHTFATIGRRIMLLNAGNSKKCWAKKGSSSWPLRISPSVRRQKLVWKKPIKSLETFATELKRVAQVKTEFLPICHMKLRTPLNSINGFSEVLYDETFGPLNVKQKQYVNNVLTSGKHLLY